MELTSAHHSAFRIPHSRRRGGFSLVELLTVIFIISLLIAILVPSLNTARNAAKKLTTSKTINAIAAGLEMFKNDNGPDFAQTNGYPPSYAHPPIDVALTPLEASQGHFPFKDGKPQVNGAHWLPAMLMGVDKLCYIKKSSVPAKDNLRQQPERWYTPDPLSEGKTLERTSCYLDPGGTPILATNKLPGRGNPNLFPSWTEIQDLPVIVDAFSQPILYYVANTHGRPTNMVGDDRDPDNRYAGGPQESGPPYYFHQDNAGFTGKSLTEPGWDFGTLGALGHAIARSGAAMAPADFLSPDETNRNTFARYIVDRKIYSDLTAKFGTSPGGAPETTPLRPVNADTCLLISAGVDGRYGTSDDVSNLPPWPQD